MTFRIKILLSFFILFATTAIAASIDNTASAILSGGYAFRADSLSLNSLEQSLRIESNLPDPRIDGEFLAASEGESDRWGAELSWELDWPGLYGAKRSDADKRIAAAKENIRTKQMARLRDVKGLLLDYIFYTKKIEILEQLNLSNDSIYQFAEIAAKAGEITVLDLNKAKLEKANVRAALDASINDRLETVAEIISIAGYDCSDLLASLDCEFPPLSIPSDDDLERIANLSPEIREAVSETIIAESGKKVARMEALPSISFGYKHAFEDGIHFNGGTLGFSLPVFSSRNKQK